MYSHHSQQSSQTSSNRPATSYPLESSGGPRCLPANDEIQADFMTYYGSTLHYPLVEGYVNPHWHDHQGESLGTDAISPFTLDCFAGDSNLFELQSGDYSTDQEAFQCLDPSQGSFPFLPLPETPVWVDPPPAASVGISPDSLQDETNPIFSPLHPLPQPEYIPQPGPIFAVGGPQQPSSARGFDGMSIVSTGVPYSFESIHEANLGSGCPFNVEVGCRSSHIESFHQPESDIIASTAISLDLPHPSSVCTTRTPLAAPSMSSSGLQMTLDRSGQNWK